MKRPRRPPVNPALATAERVHQAAIRLLRLLRREDAGAGLTAPKLSALSVLAFGGAQTLKQLAASEQVSLPTMSRLVSELEAAGLAQRTVDAADRRSAQIRITPAGQALMEAGRARRLERLAGLIGQRNAEEQALLLRSSELLLELCSSERKA